MAMPVPTTTNLLFILFHHFFFYSLMDGKNQIIQTQVVKVLFFFCKYLIVFKHCFINISDMIPCLISFT